MTILDGIVTRMERVNWQPDDDKERIKYATPIGRARVRLAGDTEVDALLFSSTAGDPLGDRLVAFFEPGTGRLVVLPYGRTEVADGR